MGYPKVSVIITAYNVQKYIKRTVESVVNQTLKNIEIIVINDGSIDCTKNIIEELANSDDRIIIVNKQNGGVSSARNKGLSLVKGEFIFQLDGDDWIEPECLEEMVGYAEKHNLDIVVTNFYIDFDNGDIQIMKDLPDILFLNSEQYLEKLFTVNSYPSLWNKLFRKELFNNIYYPENVSLGEDLAKIPELALKAKKIGKYDRHFLHYIQNVDGITKSGISKKIYQLFISFEIIEDTLIKYKVSREIVNLFKIYKLNHIINFITSKPYWEDKNYLTGFDKTLELLKASKEVPENLSILKKIILRVLILFPRKFVLKCLINIIETIKNIRKIFKK